MDSGLLDSPIEFCKFCIYVSHTSDYSYKLIFSGVQVFDLQKYIRRALCMDNVYEVLVRYGDNLDKFVDHSKNNLTLAKVL